MPVGELSKASLRVCSEGNESAGLSALPPIWWGRAAWPEFPLLTLLLFGFIALLHCIPGREQTSAVREERKIFFTHMGEDVKRTLAM
jgi:hypothetical protein